MQTTPFAEYRCSCGRLLFKGLARSSQIEIKCRRCSKIVCFGKPELEDASIRYGMIVDAEGSIKQVSETAITVLGYSREELLSMNTKDLSLYSSSERARFDFPVTFDQLHSTKSGSSIMVRARIDTLRTTRGVEEIHSFEIREPRAMLVRDVPGREGFRVRELVAEVDREGRCVYISAALGAFLSKNSFSLLGSSLFDLFHEEDRAPQRLWFAEMMASRSAYSVVGVRMIIGDKEKLVSVYALPMYRDDGRLRGYSILFES